MRAIRLPIDIMKCMSFLKSISLLLNVELGMNYIELMMLILINGDIQDQRSLREQSLFPATG